MSVEKFDDLGVPHWWSGLVRDIGLHLDIDALRKNDDCGEDVTLTIDGAVITARPGKGREVILTSTAAILPPAPDATLLETCLTANLHAVREGAPVISIEPDTRAVVLQQRIACEDDVVSALRQIARGASVLRERLGA